VKRFELLRTLVERQARLRSKRSVFGVAWPLTAPLFLLGLYSVVFGSVFRVPVDHYGVYLFAGLLPWTFLVQASHDALQSISFEPDLVRRAPLPYHYLPLARVIVMAIPFAALLAVFIVYVLVRDLPPRPALLPVLALPVASVVLLVATIAMLLALLDVFSRDLRFVLHNVLTVWFFLVPIVYSRRMMSGRLRAFTAADPMRRIVDQFRDVLYDGKVESLAPHLLTLAACAAAFVGGLTLFRRLAVDLAKDV
jgi:ABC-type polysaccharide/polyol phosphate export permease